MGELPIDISITLQLYIQVSSIESFRVTTRTRVMEAAMMKIVREKMPPRASFLRIVICAFQTRVVGMMNTAIS